MGVNLSITQLVVIVLSIFALIGGIVYLYHISTLSEGLISTDLQTGQIREQNAQSQRITFSVYPENSRTGTVFSVTASVWPKRERQDLSLTVQGQNKEVALNLYDDGNHNDGVAKDGVYGGLFNSQNLPIGTYSVKDLSQNSLGELTLYEPGCEPLIGVASPEKINFLVIPYGYTDINDFKKDAQNLILTGDSLLQVEPFKSQSGKFSFSFIEPKEDLECEVGCKGVENMVCCNDQKISDAASQCHNNGIIVMVNSDAGCGTASFYTKICAKSEYAGLILTHELGHSFGNLADEYVYSENFDSYNIPDSYVLQFPNCAEAGCEKWKDTTSECIPGCTSSNLFRSSENSIMRYVSFGKFNEVSQKNIQDVISKHQIQEENIQSKNLGWRSYSTSLSYNEGEVSLSPVYLSPTQASLYSTDGSLTARVLDDQNQLLYETPVFLPLLEFPADDLSQPILNDQITLPLSIPFISNADSLEISDDKGKILTTTSLAIFSNNCGNNVCDATENSLNCAADCDLTSDQFCSDDICDPDCPSQSTCNQSKKSNYLFPIILIFVAITIIVSVLIISRKNTKS